MLVDGTRTYGKFLVVDRCLVPFSLADEGTKVSMHSLCTLFVLIV